MIKDLLMQCRGIKASDINMACWPDKLGTLFVLLPPFTRSPRSQPQQVVPCTRAGGDHTPICGKVVTHDRYITVTKVKMVPKTIQMEKPKDKHVVVPKYVPVRRLTGAIIRRSPAIP